MAGQAPSRTPRGTRPAWDPTRVGPDPRGTRPAWDPTRVGRAESGTSGGRNRRWTLGRGLQTNGAPSAAIMSGSWVDHSDNPFQVVDGRKLNKDAALPSSNVHPHSGLEVIR
jgi:hypothetical protein